MTNKTYDRITTQLIESMENCDDWQLPWRRVPLSGPSNPVTGTNYSGINHLVLLVEQLRQGFESPLWLTYKQAQKVGGQVRKGEKGSAILFYKTLEKEQKDGELQRIPMARSYTVFNVAQIDGLSYAAPEPQHTPPSKILEWCESRGATIRHGGNEAFFYPAKDTIQMPHMSQFSSENAYAATLLHELTHWTGHSSRLDRLDVKNKKGYAFEELIAELGSVFLCSHHGIEYQMDHHASYARSWLKSLSDDSSYIVKAASLAQKAVGFLLADQAQEQQAA